MKSLLGAALFWLVCFSQAVCAQSMSSIHQVKPTRYVSLNAATCAPSGVRMTKTGIELTARDGTIISGEFDSSGRITKFRVGNITSEIVMGANGKHHSIRSSDGQVITFRNSPITPESRQRFRSQVRAIAKDNSCSIKSASGEFATRPVAHSIVKAPFEPGRNQGKFGLLKTYLTDEEEALMMEESTWEDYFIYDWSDEMDAWKVGRIANPTISCQLAYDSCMNDLIIPAAVLVSTCGTFALSARSAQAAGSILMACVGGGILGYHYWRSQCEDVKECKGQ